MTTKADDDKYKADMKELAELKAAKNERDAVSLSAIPVDLQMRLHAAMTQLQHLYGNPRAGSQPPLTPADDMAERADLLKTWADAGNTSKASLMCLSAESYRAMFYGILTAAAEGKFQLYNVVTRKWREWDGHTLVESPWMLMTSTSDGPNLTLRAAHLKTALNVGTDGARVLYEAMGIKMGAANYNGFNTKLYKGISWLVYAAEATDFAAGELCPAEPFIEFDDEGEFDASHNPSTKITHDGEDWQAALTLKEANRFNQMRKQCVHGKCKCGLMPACTYINLNG